MANEAHSAELALIILYPTRAGGIIIVLLKTSQKYRKLNFKKNKNALKIMRTLTIFVEHGIMAQIIAHDF